MYPGGGFPGAWLGRHPLGCLCSQGGAWLSCRVGGWKGVPSVKKGMGSTNQILKENSWLPQKPQMRERGWPWSQAWRHRGCCAN